MKTDFTQGYDTKVGNDEMTLSEIAKNLEISVTTVSRAISGKGRISEATREKVSLYLEQNHIEKKVKESGYAKKQTRNICITLPREDNYAELPYFQKVLLGLCDYFSVYEFNVIPVKTSLYHIGDLENIVSKHKIDGVVLTRVMGNDPAIGFLQSRGVPFIVIGSYEDANVCQVDVDQKNGCRDLTNILLRMGIKKIALFCADFTQNVTKNRYLGFCQAYEENGIRLKEEFVFENTADPSIAEKLTETMLKEDIECIACMDDNICINVVRALRKFGVEIPKDMKVVSFYNSILLDGFYPPISCVDFNIKEVSEVTGKLMLSLLEEKRSPKRILLGYNIILKDSTK